MIVRAYLTGNRRDINTGVPKALLINLENFNRNHCWITLTEEIEKLQPLGHKKPIKVEIEAKVISYIKQGIEKYETLKVKKIRRI